MDDRSRAARLTELLRWAELNGGSARSTARLSLLLPPLWLLVGLLCIAWIKAVSKGAVIFRQQRVGYRARTFTLLKFRTMREGAEADSKVHESNLKSLIEDGAPMTKLDNPLSPPLRSPQQRPQGHPAKSKFLAIPPEYAEGRRGQKSNIS